MLDLNTRTTTHQALPASLVATQHGEVTVLRLSRPEKRNALDVELIAAIEAFFSDPPEGTHAVVLHGEGNHFSAGADLSTFVDPSGSAGIEVSRMWHRAFDRIEYSRVPVVAVLHGGVIGGGLELAAAAHIRVAERSTYYALPEGTRGIFVGGGAAVRVPRLIGTARTMDMLLTGRTYGAEEGLALGFSQYVVDNGEGLATGIALAERIATNAPLSNFAMIQALPRIARSDPDSGLFMESLMVTLAVADDEAKARIRAFFDKRAPKTIPHSASVG